MPRRDRSLVEDDGLIAVHVDPDTLALLQAEAARAGLSIADFFRQAAVTQALRSQAADVTVHQPARTVTAADESESVFRATADWSEVQPLYSGACCSGVMSLGGWLATCVAANDRSHVAAAIRDAIDRRAVVELEYDVTGSDGLTAAAQFRAVPLVGADGEVTEWLAAVREHVGEGRPEAAGVAI